MDTSDDAAKEPQRTHQTTTCPHCGAEVPIASYCSRCGEPLRPDVEPRAGAPPADPLADTTVISTPGAKSAGIARFLPGVGQEQVDAYRLAIGVGVVLVIVALLLGSAGSAITIAVFIIPVVTLMYFTDTDLYEREPVPILLAVLAAGFVAGLVVALISDFLVDELWIDGASFNIGAAGFGGEVAEREGSPPFLVLILCGLFLPVLGLGLALAVPVFLRRWAAFRNEVLDGMTLGAAAGGGFAAAGTIVYYWPLFGDGSHPGGSLSDWTATLLGLLLLRPLLLGIAGALIGAAVWHYSFQLQSSDLSLPLAASLGGVVVYATGDLLIQPSGAIAELIWLLVVVGALLFATRLVLNRALAQDRQALATSSGRIVCPHCSSITPLGAFCAVCGKPLVQQGLAESRPSAEPARTAPAPSTEEAPTPEAS